MEQTIQTPQIQTPPKKGSNKLMIIGCSCLALLILCTAVVGGTMYALRNTKFSEGDQSTQNDQNKDGDNQSNDGKSNDNNRVADTTTPSPLPTTNPSITTIPSNREDRKYTNRQEMSQADIEKYRLKVLAEADSVALEKIKDLRKFADFYPDNGSTDPTVSPTRNQDGSTVTPTRNSDGSTPTPTKPGTLVSPTPGSPRAYKDFLSFITPNAPEVQAIAKNKTKEQLYKDSLNWVWVEDLTLHKTNELWMRPADFLKNTPNMETNPIKGRIASDCEEHAMGLVSALRAIGVKPEHVRVSIGKVNFGGSVGGHAWVQFYDEKDQRWFELEPSAGDTVDPKTKQYSESDGFPFDYFKTNKYSSVEEVFYFNDTYFMDLTSKTTNAPSNW